DRQCLLERRQCVSICSGVQQRFSESPVGVCIDGWRLETARSLNSFPRMPEHCAGIAEHPVECSGRIRVQRRKQIEITGFVEKRDGLEVPSLRFLRAPQKAQKEALVVRQMGAVPAVRRGVGRTRCPFEFGFRNFKTGFGDAEPPLEGSGPQTRAKKAEADRQFEPGVFEALGQRESFLAISKRLLCQSVSPQEPRVTVAQMREATKIALPSGEVLPGGVNKPRFFHGQTGALCGIKESRT